MSKAYKFTLAQKGFLICQNNIFILYQFFILMIFCRAMELRNKERAKILSAKIQSNLSKRMSNYFASVSTSGEEFLSSEEYYLKIF